jgi:hypothetical protein
MTSEVSIEQKLADALRQRTPCDFSAGTEADELENSSQWGPERTIDSSLLRKLLTNGNAGSSPADQPLEIIGARIDGVADFRATSVARPIYFLRCVFTKMIDCTDARMSTTSFQKCVLVGLRARYTQFSGSLLLRECQLAGPLDLLSASVSRDVDLRGSELSALAPIDADRVDVGGSVYLRDGFRSEARISLEGAQIASALDGVQGKFRNTNGTALLLNAAKIGGFCTFACAEFKAKNLPAVSADGAQIGGFLSFERAKVDGSLMLRGMRIGYNLNLIGTTIANFTGTTTVDLGSAKVGGDLLMKPFETSSTGSVGCSVVGSIFLFNASFDGSIMIQGASIEVSGDQVPVLPALVGEGLRVGGYLVLIRSTIKGLVTLRDAQIGRGANLSGTKIDNPGRTALDLERAKFGGDVFIRPFERPDAPSERQPGLVVGGINMRAAMISGSLSIRDSSVQNGDQQLRFNQMNVTGVFDFTNITCGTGMLSLANAKVFAFTDEGTRWPNPGSLRLNGFDYSLLTGKAPTGWRPRLDWLQRFEPDEFNPQPFTTLATVLRRAGHDQDAKMIAMARQREARKYLRRGSPPWLGSILMEATCGHGYRPWLAAVWIFVFIAIGAGVFNLPPAERVPLKEPAATLLREGKPLPAGYPPFVPVIYSADVLLPIVNLQQKDYWAPNSERPRGHWARRYLPLHILAGWFFTTLFVVGVTGLIRRD